MSPWNPDENIKNSGVLMFSGVTEEALITFLRPCEVARNFLDIHYLLYHDFWGSLGKNWSNGQRWVKPSYHLTDSFLEQIRLV